MRAAVVRRRRVVDIDDHVGLSELAADEVRVRIRATSVCQSDLHALDGAVDTPFPLVLGHEGAGVVVEVGSAVSRARVGDHVLIAMVPVCGRCARCLGGQASLCQNSASLRAPARFMVDGGPASGFIGIGSFAEEILLPEASVLPIPMDIPFDQASLLSCGVSTGLGAVLNRARVEPGSSVVIIGCGGVGLAMVQGARIARAAMIVAVEPMTEKWPIISSLGATHVVSPGDLSDAIDLHTEGQGFDFGFDGVGSSTTIRAAWDATRRGGVVTSIGGAPDDEVTFNARELFFAGKTIHGSVYGSVDVRVDILRFIDLWRAGHLNLADMISHRRSLDELEAVVSAMRTGTGLRQVIEMGEI